MTLLQTEAPAPIASLSTARRIAVLACFHGDGLQKLNGRWVAQSAPAEEARIAGVTVSDLSRDGLLIVNATTYQKATARLTDRGKWFARTLVASLGPVD